MFQWVCMICRNIYFKSADMKGFYYKEMHHLEKRLIKWICIHNNALSFKIDV